MTPHNDAGSVFPPRDEWDVLHYNDDEVVDGYLEHRIGDIPPGPNRSPAYRWGWTNGRKDASGEDDGYEDIRRAFFRLLSNAT